MTKRRVNKVQKSVPAPPVNNINNGDQREESHQIDETTQQVDPQMAAIRAIRDIETNRLVMSLKLLRSYFNKQQLQTPLLPYFERNLPNLSIAGNGNEDQIEVKWKTNFTNHADGINMHESLLHQLSLAYHDSCTLSAVKGYNFSSKATKRNGPSLHDLQFECPVMDVPSGSKTIGFQDGLQTPGATSHRLSVGVTPKTLRLPKKGEMLLSIRGSPLGVYMEDSMEPINETEED